MGASVHPYDVDFERRTKMAIDAGAVLMKWLPSAQQFSLADPKVRDRMKFLATAGHNGKPLPILLHIGPEYAIPSTDERTQSYDCLSWTWQDKFTNFWRFGKRWHTPDTAKIHENIRIALSEGAVIIFAHCGLPYFVSGPLGKFMEHDEFDVVRQYLDDSANGKYRGKCYADVSALATPFRQARFKDVEKLPQELLLYGSDFPTPAFELSADIKENWEDFRAMLEGDLSRVIIPEDNLLDVNLHELRCAFPGHSMFYNFARQLLPGV